MTKIILPLAFGFLLAVTTVTAQDNPLAEAQRSHVDANVPDEKDFDRMLQRDITAYVTDRADGKINVTVELLRIGATQSGVALPKFYVWIEKRSANGVLMEQAAARIAAIERKRFEVIQYYKREQMVAEPELIKKVFPAAVCEKILTKLNGTTGEK